jgi:hypothetical protein
MKSCPYCGAKYPDEIAVCPIDQHPLEEPDKSQTDVPKTPKKIAPCPTCGATDGYMPTVELRGSFSWLIFFMGGILAVVFRNAGRRKKVRCTKCDATFFIHPPLSRISVVIFWLLIAPTILFLFILLVHLFHMIFIE